MSPILTQARLLVVVVAAWLQLAAVTPQTQVWLRLPEAVQNLRIDPHGRYLAYQAKTTQELKVLHLESKNIFSVSKRYVGGAFFWAPGGHRLFYRELQSDRQQKITSNIKVFDVAQRRSHQLESFASSSGLLTFDPRDLTFQLMHAGGIKVKKIYYPSNRLAKWQIGRRTQGGKWLATQRGMLLVDSSGRAYVKLEDDGTGLAAFAIAPRGDAVLWGTQGGRIYLQQEGGEVSYIDRGRDPSWHPQGQLFAYAKSIYVGNRLVDYDLQLRDRRGQGRFLTRTRFSRERWPVWKADGQQILFTREKTTDIFALLLRSQFGVARIARQPTQQNQQR